jgi:hypothetical protein
MQNWNMSEEDRNKLVRNRIWSIALTSGSITASVLYWVSQLPKAQQFSVLAAVSAVLGVK